MTLQFVSPWHAVWVKVDGVHEYILPGLKKIRHGCLAQGKNTSYLPM